MARQKVLKRLFLTAAIVLTGLGGQTLFAQDNSAPTDTTTQTVVKDKPWANDPSYVKRLTRLETDRKDALEELEEEKKYREEQARLEKKSEDDRISADEKDGTLYYAQREDIIGYGRFKSDIENRKKQAENSYKQKKNEIKRDISKRVKDTNRQYDDEIDALDDEFAKKPEYQSTPQGQSQGRSGGVSVTAGTFR